MKNIKEICDFVIFRLTGEGDSALSHLKLQKILYYIQSWHLALENEPMFDGKFQAWIHGPVNRDIYNRFKDTKYMYSSIDMSDLKDVDMSFSTLTEANKLHVNSVLEVYAPFSDTQLEDMTHRENPWIEARQGYEPHQRCEQEINEQTMRDYYAARLK